MILFWVGALAVVVLLYVLLDGFDLGVGILFGFTRDEQHRLDMLAAIAPVWDGNETWLILSATILFGIFPVVYATLLSAFYLPLMLMLGALILRGVAFEFRPKASAGTRWIWDCGFFGGSLIAAFVQGLTVGALVVGLPMEGGQYAGGMFSWLSPFACVCGAGLCLGYALLGAGWLVAKGEGQLRAHGYALLPCLIAAVFVFLAIAFGYALALKLGIMDRWIQRPYLLVFPALGAFAGGGMIAGIRQRRDLQPFRMMILVFLSAFGTLAVSFWPYMIPNAITVYQAAAPRSTLYFMFWGAGLVVLPITLGYTATVYRVFSGKIRDDGGRY